MDVHLDTLRAGMDFLQLNSTDAKLRICVMELQRATTTNEKIGATNAVLNELQGHPARSQRQLAAQNSAIRMGMLRELARLVMSEEPNDVQANALLCLSELAFANFDVKLQIYAFPGLVTCLRDSLANVAVSSVRYSSKDENAFWLLNALASQLWDQHPEIISMFLPIALDILRNRSQPTTMRGCSIRLLNLLSYNENNIELLQEAAHPLIEMMCAQDEHSFTAALALANLGGSPTNPTNHWRDAPQRLFTELREALNSALNKCDFPIGSGNYYTAWKLAVSITRLSMHAENRASIKREGILAVLVGALRAKAKKDPQFVENALKVVWNVYSP